MNQTAVYLDKMVQSSSNGTLAFVIVLPPSIPSVPFLTKRQRRGHPQPQPKPQPQPQLPIPTAVDEGKVIGHAGLWVAGSNELLFMLAQPYWGQGYMTEVLGKLVPIFWEKGLTTVYADVHPACEGGLRVLGKVGFKQVRKDIIESHHVRETSLHMELIIPEYREGRREIKGEGEGEIRGEGEGKGKGKEKEGGEGSGGRGLPLRPWE